ncbi:alpha/beta hydrolase [Acidovorax sp. Leaf160]|uniref:alpha/beta hydrolase n=1 Tax=Acidovorax sp. Leaf160 TaxID=1736280 RepID=UPI0006FBB21E|nr:alpha/beta hydrolase [Acidovorax sp. Leaf160]KQR49958.1 alpha/beta hydrolase [Acidovorax sp. Leaf160]
MPSSSTTAPSPAHPPLPACTDATIEVARGRQVGVRVYGKKPKTRAGSQPGAALPLVVHFHGGAFVSGDLDNGGTVATLLQGAGALVVSVAYPLAPFPEPLETGYAVLQWAFKHRTRLAGSGAPVYLAGEEAGGNLAAGVGLMARDQSHPPIAGQILLSPMLDPCVGTPSVRAATGDSTACKWSVGWTKFLSCTRDAEHPYAVPAAAQRLAGLPPTLVLVGSDDPMRDEALAYAARLEAAGQPVTRHIFNQAAEWPEALLQQGAGTCPCAPEVQAQLRQFFEATRCRPPL